MNLGLSGPTEPTPETPPTGNPATVHQLRDLLKQVDAMLNESRRMGTRTVYSTKEVVDLLLDVRSILDRLTAPITLIQMATEINDENIALRRSLGE